MSETLETKEAGRTKDEGRKNSRAVSSQRSDRPSEAIVPPVLFVSRKRGFTLVEMVLSIAIIGVISIALAPTIVSTVSHYALISGRRGTVADIKVAMDRMIIEMRLIPDTDNIVAFSASSITFNTFSASNITYAVSGGNLQRSGVTLVSGVTSLTFSYLDANGVPTAVKSDIKRIVIELVANTGGTSGTIRLRSAVFPRRFSTGYGGYQ